MNNDERREHRRELWRTWAAEHRDELRARDRAARCNGKSKADYWRNPDKARARQRRWKAAHPKPSTAETRTYMAAWRMAHPESRRTEYALHRAAYLHRAKQRKARVRGAVGSYTAQEWRDKVALLGGCCLYCGRDDLPLTADHKIPLIRGGSNDISNVVPACGPCNARKHTRTAKEFIAA